MSAHEQISYGCGTRTHFTRVFHKVIGFSIRLPFSCQVAENLNFEQFFPARRSLIKGETRTGSGWAEGSTRRERDRWTFGVTKKERPGEKLFIKLIEAVTCHD